MLQIRHTAITDLFQIHNLIEQLEEHPLDKELFAGVFLKNLQNPLIFYFTSEADGHIVGFVSMHIQFLLHHTGEIAEVQELCVDEKHRCKSYGKKMLDHVISIARGRGCELIELTANRKRDAAHRFYEREGWNRSHFKFTLPLR